MKLSLRAKSILLSLVLVLAPMPEVSAADTRYLDVAQITWSGAKTPEVSSADVVNSIQSQVTPNWRSFTSLEGDSRDRSVTFAHGITLESPIRLTSAMLCDRVDFTGFMNSIRDEVYRQLGLTDWRDRYLIILTPEAGCIWSGRASVGSFNGKGGVMVLHNTASAFVITH